MTLSSRCGKTAAFLLRECRGDDLEAILEAQERVLSDTPPELFVRTSREEIAESLELDLCLGLFTGAGERQLAAFSLAVRNRLTPRNLGTALGYDEARLLQCVTYDTTFVLPEYRGYGIQRELCRVRDCLARDWGIREALATASPDNLPSVRNILSEGFTVLAEKPMYGGLRRYILGKKL